MAASKPPEGMMWRMVLTVVMLGVFLIAPLIYVAFYATGFDLFQKVVVVIISFIVFVVLTAILWMSWPGSWMNMNRRNRR